MTEEAFGTIGIIIVMMMLFFNDKKHSREQRESRARSIAVDTEEASSTLSDTVRRNLYHPFNSKIFLQLLEKFLNPKFYRGYNRHTHLCVSKEGEYPRWEICNENAYSLFHNPYRYELSEQIQKQNLYLSAPYWFDEWLITLTTWTNWTDIRMSVDIYDLENELYFLAYANKPEQYDYYKEDELCVLVRWEIDKIHGMLTYSISHEQQERLKEMCVKKYNLILSHKGYGCIKKDSHYLLALLNEASRWRIENNLMKYKKLKERTN